MNNGWCEECIGLCVWGGSHTSSLTILITNDHMPFNSSGFLCSCQTADIMQHYAVTQPSLMLACSQ